MLVDRLNEIWGLFTRCSLSGYGGNQFQLLKGIYWITGLFANVVDKIITQDLDTELNKPAIVGSAWRPGDELCAVEVNWTVCNGVY